MTTTPVAGAVRSWARFRGKNLKLEAVFALAGLAVVWQIVSFFVPHYLFPTVPQIADRFETWVQTALF